MHRLSHGLWNPPPTIVCLHRCETTRPSEQEEGKGVEEMRPHLGRSRWRSRTRKKKKTTWEHEPSLSSLSRPRRLCQGFHQADKGGKQRYTHLLPYSHVSRFASCFLSLYYSNTCVFVLFFFTSLSLFPLVLFLVYETCSPSSAWAFVIELLLYDTRKHIIFLLLLSFRLPNKGQWGNGIFRPDTP